LSTKLDKTTESRLERAVTTFLSVHTKSCSFDDCPKESVAEKNVMIMTTKCLNIIAAYHKYTPLNCRFKK